MKFEFDDIYLSDLVKNFILSSKVTRSPTGTPIPVDKVKEIFSNIPLKSAAGSGLDSEDSDWSSRDSDAILQENQAGAHFKSLIEGVLLAPLDSW